MHILLITITTPLLQSIKTMQIDFDKSGVTGSNTSFIGLDLDMNDGQLTIVSTVNMTV